MGHHILVSADAAQWRRGKEFLMDWNMSWLFTGLLAYVFVLVNLSRTARGKQNGWQVLLFASLSCGALTMLCEYQMVNIWVQHGDIAALCDVVPSMVPLLTGALLVGLLLNLLVLLANLPKGNTAD